jgi:peptidoglycan/LPS O-acetylase OafA/YrhL
VTSSQLEVRGAAGVAPGRMPHFPVLDGWRGISILLVLLGHLLPLGPSQLQMNAAVAALGMAVFFTLSGFLITSTLLYRPSVREFLIRRVFRIVPLAWVFILVSLVAVKAPASYFPAELLFYANLPPFWLADITGHLWSLCVEMQFYAAIALLFALFRRKGLYLLPLLCVAITLIRIVTHTKISIVTYKRVDEILAGACLVLLVAGDRESLLCRVLGKGNAAMLLALALLCSHPNAGSLNYIRPYVVACCVGCSLLRPEQRVTRMLTSRWLLYLAEISYALYVLHPIAAHGWFGSGSKLMRYGKRVPALLLVFGAAHLSTFYYEHFWIGLGKRWSRRFAATASPAAVNQVP